MPYIESVSIEDFWGNHSVKLEFDPKVNFLIGKNGSGKTTAIEIIASALQIDEEALERLPFTKVEITLFDKETKRKPKIIVRKLDQNDRSGVIAYSIQHTSRASVEEMREFFPFMPRGYRTLRDERGRIESVRERSLGGMYELKKELNSIISTNWLSINRISPTRPLHERGAVETLADRKTREVSDRLERYFSELSSKANANTRNFQRKFFRSLIQLDGSFSIGNIPPELDLQKEKKALASIFIKFGMPSDEYRDDLNQFFSHLSAIQEDKDKNSYTSDDLVALINAHKIHSLVGEWNEVGSLERNTLMPRDAFVKILGEMLHRKEAEVLPSGEMNFKSRSGKDLKISDLSSGEKQLYIILGEALLQRDAEWTYLADEPELSLHVDWQEVLVDNLRTLNPNCQVIFATHSPDIVSHYSKSIIDMEKSVA